MSVVALLHSRGAPGARVPVITGGVLLLLADHTGSAGGLAGDLLAGRYLSVIADDRLSGALDALGVLHITDQADGVAQVGVLGETVLIHLALAEILGAAAYAGRTRVCARACVLVVAQGTVGYGIVVARR